MEGWLAQQDGTQEQAASAGGIANNTPVWQRSCRRTSPSSTLDMPWHSSSILRCAHGGHDSRALWEQVGSRLACQAWQTSCKRT